MWYISYPISTTMFAEGVGGAEGLDSSSSLLASFFFFCVDGA